MSRSGAMAAAEPATVPKKPSSGSSPCCPWTALSRSRGGWLRGEAASSRSEAGRRGSSSLNALQSTITYRVDSTTSVEGIHLTQRSKVGLRIRDDPCVGGEHPSSGDSHACAEERVVSHIAAQEPGPRIKERSRFPSLDSHRSIQANVHKPGRAGRCAVSSENAHLHDGLGRVGSLHQDRRD